MIKEKAFLTHYAEEECEKESCKMFLSESVFIISGSFEAVLLLLSFLTVNCAFENCFDKLFCQLFVNFLSVCLSLMLFRVCDVIRVCRVCLVFIQHFWVFCCSC